MFKGILIAALLAVSGAAFAADFSSVGSTGVEATVDYSYARSINTPEWASAHVALAGLQANLGGLGSVAIEAGDTQRVGTFRLNYTTFAIGYANGFRVGSVGVVGALAYSDQTGDKWFLSGNNSSLPISTGTATVELNAPVSHAIKAFADYSYGYSWSGNINSFYGNRSLVTSEHTNVGAVGAYLNLSSNVVGKVGYARSFGVSAAPNTQGLVASLSYKF